jgi:hypothetical protein
MMTMIMIMIMRRRKEKTGLGLMQSMRLQEAASSRPTDKAGRISDFVLKLFVRNFSYTSIYTVNSGLCIGGGQTFIFALGPVISHIGPNGDRDDDDNNNNNNNNNNKVVAKCE